MLRASKSKLKRLLWAYRQCTTRNGESRRESGEQVEGDLRTWLMAIERQL